MDTAKIIDETTCKLLAMERETRQVKHPNPANIARIIELVREAVFSHHYMGCCSQVAVEQKVREIFRLLEAESSTEVAAEFVASLPEIKRLLITDTEAIYKGDPAAESHAEVVFCYPALSAMLNHRVAHILYGRGLAILPRMIAEMAHSATGIDIHPAASIGEYFSIDHGTGVVIGQTTIIGRWVRLYQGVTLGARSFECDENGNLINTPRHPIIEDNVVIYSNTSVLGRITIGRGSVIGGNVWLTQDVPQGSKITQSTINISK